MSSTTRRISSVSAPLLFVVVFFATGYILFPLYSILKQSVLSNAAVFSLEAYRPRSSLFEATLNSVVISLLSVLGSGVVGTFLAYVFASFDFPGRKVLSKLVLVPLALPPLVGVISFMFLVGESGMLSRALAHLTGLMPATFSVGGWTGIVLVHIYSFYVYFYLFVSAALSRLDGEALEASISLQASRMRTVRRILLPMLTPSLVGASLMTFMASMASFSAPFLFGGTTRFLTLEIYSAKLNGDDPSAAALAVLLSAASVSMLLFLRWWQSGRRYIIDSKGSKGVARISYGGSTRIIAAALTALLALFFALPIITIVVLSFVREGSWTYQIYPSSFTAQNYLRLFDEPLLLQPLVNSIRLSLAATAAVLLLGVSSAYLISRKDFFGKRFLEAVLSLPYGIPGTVIAVGLIVAFNRPSLFSFQSIFVGTVWILPLAYTVRNLPLLYRSTAAGFESMSPSLQEAADVLGSSGLRTFRRIVLPMIMPSIASGALLVFINSAGEFVSSILLYSFFTKPISVEILSQLRLFNVGAAAMYSTLLMALVFVVAALSDKYYRSTFSG